MAHDVFISHSTNNRPVANAVCAALESAGIRCWIAPRDVMPGRSYSGEITRAIQQSRAFVLIFSQHSNNSEQVLREVQLAANSRLHIVQFRIDPVSPSDDLEYYLSGPHWLDAVTPPLEDHLGQLKSSIKALLALPRTGDADKPPPPPPLSIPPAAVSPLPPFAAAIPSAPSVATSPPLSNTWKWVALIVAALAALGCVAFIILFTVLRFKPAATVPVSNPTPPPQTTVAVQTTPKTESTVAARPTLAPPSTAMIITTEEAERYAKAFYREMERGDLNKASSYLDDTVDYYAFGPKDRAFITEQMRQLFAFAPVRSFTVSDVKVQDSPKPNVATLIFDVRYTSRDGFGVSSSGHTRVEWDVTKRGGDWKIVRSNWITYPDATPSH